jgi:cytoskeletal protein CcmA (bactofilin family)
MTMALWKDGDANATSVEEKETTIGKGCELEGTVMVHGGLRVDGKVKGRLQADGQLVIGPGAQVTADVVADVLRVEGEVTGELKATTLIALQPTARVKGTLEAPSLSIERGAVFDGTCKMVPVTPSKPELVRMTA